MESVKLYHYTTETGCQSIINSGELWLSDVNSLDDGNEIAKRFKIFRQQIECSKSFKKLSIGNRTRFLSFIIDRLIEDEFFIACFCLSKTNKHLWEHYSKKYTGKCLEFEIPLPVGEDRLFALQSVPMSYRDAIACEDLQTSLDKIIYPDLEELFQMAGRIRSGLWLKQLHKHKGYIDCRNTVIEAYLRYCLGTKSEEFSPENEWRLIASKKMNTWFDETKISRENGKRVMKFPIPANFFTGIIYQTDNILQP